MLRRIPGKRTSFLCHGVLRAASYRIFAQIFCHKASTYVLWRVPENNQFQMRQFFPYQIFGRESHVYSHVFPQIAHHMNFRVTKYALVWSNILMEVLYMILKCKLIVVHFATLVTLVLRFLFIPEVA